jgi:hypothetical protein
VDVQLVGVDKGAQWEEVTRDFRTSRGEALRFTWKNQRKYAKKCHKMSAACKNDDVISVTSLKRSIIIIKIAVIQCIIIFGSVKQKFKKGMRVV